eukprot:scaffold2572_cov75-Skeletonema_marinoi.AAC.13
MMQQQVNNANKSGFSSKEKRQQDRFSSKETAQQARIQQQGNDSTSPHNKCQSINSPKISLFACTCFAILYAFYARFFLSSCCKCYLFMSTAKRQFHHVRCDSTDEKAAPEPLLMWDTD